MKKSRKELSLGNLLGGKISTVIYEIDSEKEGPSLCLIGMNHGSEYAGAKVINKIFNKVNLKKGKIIAIPIANTLASIHKSYTTPAGINSPGNAQNLNRLYPGKESNSFLTNKIAYKIFNIVKGCDCLCDLHSAGIHGNIITDIRIRDDKEIKTEIKKKSLEIAKASGIKYILKTRSRDISPNEKSGILTTQASIAGIPSATIEINGIIGNENVEEGYNAILNILNHLGMADFQNKNKEGKVYTRLHKIWSNSSGFFEYAKNLGEFCKKGEVIAKTTNIFTGKIAEVKAPFDGFWEAQYLFYVINEGDYIGEFVGE